MKIEKAEKKKGHPGPICAVVLMVAITVVLSGVLWSNPPPSRKPIQTKITATNKEKMYGWVISISSLSGNELNLDDAKFQVITDEGTREYEITINDANPAKFLNGQSNIHAMTKGAIVQDNSTGNDIDGDSCFQNYVGCYVAYLDQNSDGKVTAGDTIYVYKDYDKDGNDDILSNFVFEIIADKNICLKMDL